MSQLDDEVTVVITNKPDSELYAVFEESNFDVNVGESAKIDVGTAINYIQSGQAEIAEKVGDIIGEFNENAVEKTNAFNQNAEDKTGSFDLNATNKTNDFNTNAINKTTAFDNNATSKTGVFDDNAVDKTNAFNSNATDKTTDFNNNYTEKKALIDAEVQTAETYSNEAKQWAIGDPTEPDGNSAKYWANEVASELSGLTSRISTIEGKIPAEASASNQLADKAYVDAEDNSLQSQIDALVVASDVYDIVGTYAELQAYDISTVPVNDIIKVLVDETHSGAATYYRCVEVGGVKSWSYIGSEGAYYTKAEADSLFATPSDIGNATITLTQGGITKGTFTTNQSGNATIDVDAATIPSNMVTTDTNQTITGKKVLSGKYKTMLSNENVTKGTNPSSTQYINFGLFGDTTSSYTDRLGCMETSIDTSGNVTTYLRAYKNTASSSTAGNITVNYPASGSPYASAPTPTQDTTSSTQIDTVGARNTKLQNYALSSSLATVATSGSYNDLSDKPTIPTVNNATLTIQKNGTTVKTFTANASTNVTANITVPTKTSDITNDSGYITGISSSDVTTALGYTPANDSDVVKTRGDQNISGAKTFTGNAISQNTWQVKRTDFTKGDIPSSTKYFGLFGLDALPQDSSSTSWQDKRLSVVECNVDTSGNTTLMFGVYCNKSKADGGGNNFQIRLRKLANNTGYAEMSSSPATSDNSTKIASTAFVKAQGYATTSYVNSAADGQWVLTSATSIANEVSNPAAESEKHTFSLSSYLPDDGQIYEVLFDVETKTQTNGPAGKIARVGLLSDIMAGYLRVCYARSTSATYYSTAGASFILPIGPGRTITDAYWTDNTGTYNLRAFGYRRVGTNS